MKKISVIVPVYNVEKYLSECLDSVLSQDEKDIEVICVNDGSTDKSLEILKEYKEKDDRIIIVTQDNKGLAEARNSGLNVAKGEYIFFLDSDDKMREGTLSKLYSTAIRENVYVVTFEIALQYDIDVKEAKENIDRYYIKSQDYTGKRKGKEQFTLFMKNDDYCDSANMIFVNREWLTKKNIRFYPYIYFEDALFSLKCHLESDEIFHLAEKLYIYRIRGNSIMQSKSSMDKVYSCIVNFKKMYEILMFEQNKDEEFCEMLVKYMRLVVMNMHIMEANREGKDEFDRFNYLEKFLYDVFFVGGIFHPDERIILQGLIKNVDDSTGVYLYGAGRVGMLVNEFLTKKNLKDKVKAFVVTKKSGAQQEYCGIPVKELDELLINDDLVILSVGRNIQQEILPELEKKGITNIVCIDRNVQMILEREHERTV